MEQILVQGSLPHPPLTAKQRRGNSLLPPRERVQQVAKNHPIRAPHLVITDLQKHIRSVEPGGCLSTFVSVQGCINETLTRDSTRV